MVMVEVIASKGDCGADDIYVGVGGDDDDDDDNDYHH